MAERIGVWLVLSFAVCACARHATPSVPLPPLDAPREPVAVGAPGEYRLQPGDLLRVKFLYHPELDVKVPIRPDGAVTLQLAGEMRAAGLTTTELEKEIKERCSDRLRNPEISVMVAQLAEQKVYVGGEVKLPGFVAYKPGMSPLQAIVDRGGFTDEARIDSVLRLSPMQNDYQGTRLDFTKPLSTGSPEGTQLAAGDVLYVPRTFIGDVDSFVRLYIRGVLPLEPRVGAGTTF
ncbi:MAG TPA: polysaccharide biosynthesis/export family protein [Candidatus Acidoferrales bacterium]|nr:polysaccharide biosynthesis/export family protein [Candidatus Acidoferrales bacterium]